VDALALTFSSGWASGINSYLVVLVLGLSDRFGSFTDIPDVLARWDVLTVAGFLYAMEFIADKIPYIDSTWDAISTAIRPTAGLLSHLVKAGGRLAINSSPEPVTNIVASVGEDVAVLGVVWFALRNPEAAAVVAAVLLLLGLVMLFFVGRLVRRGWRRWKKRDPLHQVA